MKNGIFLALVWVLATALGCECPTDVRHQPAGTMSPEFTRYPGLARPQATPSVDRVAYLGVQVVPANPALRAQLGLPEDTGLVVTEVAPGSPAAQANLARFDVLIRINRQYLINPEQLAVLVRDAKPGQEVRLTVVRQARLATAMVKLGSHKASESPMGAGRPAHAMPGVPMGPRWGQGMGPNMPGRPMPGAPIGGGWGHPMPGGPMNPEMRRHEGRNELEEGDEEENEAPKGGLHYKIEKGKDGQLRVIPVPPGPQGKEGKPGAVAPEGRKGPAGQDRRDGYTGMMIFRYEENGGLTQGFRDSEYALKLVTDRKGNKTLTARSIKDPKVVFEGPIDTPAQRAKLPAPVQRRLEQIEKTPGLAPPVKRDN